MIVFREYEQRDLPRITELHVVQGLAYQLPSPDAMSVRVVIEEDGLVTHALFLRKTAEAYWLFDSSAGTKREKLGRMLILQKETPKLAKLAGFEDVSCWIPPEIAQSKAFDRTMLKLGWERPLWTDYHREVL